MAPAASLFSGSASFPERPAQPQRPRGSQEPGRCGRAWLGLSARPWDGQTEDGRTEGGTEGPAPALPRGRNSEPAPPRPRSAAGGSMGRAASARLRPRYMKNVYLFIYYLIQFCGHSWILTNMTVRFFSFGKDSMIDTFYTIGLVMRLCQSISLLELLHIYVGIESNHLFPRFLQTGDSDLHAASMPLLHWGKRRLSSFKEQSVTWMAGSGVDHKARKLTERIIILFVVITSQEEIQEKYVVCVLFIFWNLLDMVRYTHSMLAVTGTSYAVLTWLSQTLWMPIYPLCVLAEAFAIYQSLPYFESFGTYSTKMPLDLATYLPYVLKLYLLMLFIGMYFTYSHLYSERRDVLRVFSIKKKM